MFEAKILADSISTDGARLTTMELTYPRIVHAEFMTHRMFSRNAASSRAIPVMTMIEKVRKTPFIPAVFGNNKPGMQAGEALTGDEHAAAVTTWLSARNTAIEHALILHELGVHKQIVNRLLEPFQWYTVIVTATEWANFFALRCHPDAQPEIQSIARLMRDALAASVPEMLYGNQWHRPLMPEINELWDVYSSEDLNKISIGRCARVSYLTHDGKRDPAKDIELYDRLTKSGHMSPLEHVATPAPGWHGNFYGWKSVRKFVPGEANFGGLT